jgi:hypothetical protein
MSPRDSGTYDFWSDTLCESCISLFMALDGNTEEHELYREGSFYPICIGDVLDDTYCIVHKLSHGRSSTVWLARDIKEQRDVALKIMIFWDEGEDEYSMQKEIVSTVQDTSNLVTYLATFSLRGCRGNHRVLVFPVRGPSFKDTVWPQNDFFLACT